MLSTRMIDLRLGTMSDWRLSGVVLRLSTRSSRMGVLERGALYGSFVVALIIKCVAVRCDRAEIICVDVNAGFNGTCYNVC